MNYKLLADLLPYLEEFENSGKGTDVQDFMKWMNRRTKVEEKEEESFEKSKFVPLQGGVEAKIGQLIALMYKYIRFYFKKGLKDSLLQTIEDFGFLATLATFGDLKKNRLIQKNTSEFTSGMEVIRRLERNKLIQSFSDPDDKRARRVKITDLGTKVFLEALPVLRQIGAISTGDLSEKEKYQLFELLERLNIFHNPIFHEEKGSELEVIVDKYVEV